MTISTTPTTPIVGDLVTLATTLQGSAPTRWYLDSVPSESALLTAAASPHPGWLADAKGLPLATFTPDAAGEYVFRATCYKKLYKLGTSIPTGSDVFFQGETATVNVGKPMLLPLLTAAWGGATLRLVVCNQTMTAAELVDPTSEAARIAILDSAVVAALAAMVGAAPATITGDLAARASDLRTVLKAHMASAVYHNGADTTNGFQRYPADATAYAIGLVAEAIERLKGHMESGASAGRWHTNDDGKNTMVALVGSTLGSSTVALCDARARVYDRHRTQIASPAVHPVSDTANTLIAATLLDGLVLAFFDAIVDAAGTAPAGESKGATALALAAGFTAA